MAQVLPQPPASVPIFTTDGKIHPLWQNFFLSIGAAVGTGTAPADAQYWVSTSNPDLTSERNLGALADGYLRIVTPLGQATPSTVLPIPGTDIGAGIPDGSLSSNVPLKNGTNAFTGANSFATSPVDLLVGQLAFPATQNPSSNVNTLDDYEEGTWTPAFTFATVGDLSVTFSVQTGFYTKIGNTVRANWALVSSAFTHTTASGLAQITGFPFPSANVALDFHFGSLQWQGITKATYTQVTPQMAPNTSLVLLEASGSGVAISPVVAADLPTGGSLNLSGTIVYQAAT